MENTHYLTYDPDSIWLNAIDAYVAAGGDILYPGDAKEMLLRSVQAIVMQVFAGTDAALCQATLINAIGPYLDLYAQRQKLGCVRLPAEAARCTARITFTGRAQTIPAGTLLTADGEMLYSITEDVEYKATNATVDCKIICTEAGAAGNGLIAGTQLMLVTPISGVTSIYTTTDATGGCDTEDDEAYRERIRTYGITSVTTGPATQYEAAAREVSEDIIDAKAKRISAGVVGVYLLIDKNGDSSALKEAVKTKLQEHDTRPLTDDVHIMDAECLSYTLDIRYACETGSSISTQLDNAVSAYKSWQDHILGRAFNPEKLKAMLYDAGATRVVIGDGSVFNGGIAEYTQIEETQYTEGNINLAVIDA